MTYHTHIIAADAMMRAAERLRAFSAATASAMLRVRSLRVRRCVVCLDVEDLGGNTIGRD
jgi:hypothetical protein